MSPKLPLVRNNCHLCVYKAEVLGNAHIRCRNPDPRMTGDPHGIRSGWFFYPYVFDPTWMTKKCDNFTPKPVAA